MTTRLKPLHEQAVVVFGASSGIGRETAYRFAAAGAKVAVVGRREENLDSLVAEITRQGGQAFSLVADAADFAQVQAAADLVAEQYGRVDTWVQVAGVTTYAPFEQTTPEEFRRVVEVTLLGQAYAAMAALPHLRRAGGGALVCVSSVAAEVPLPYQSAYNAAKHGVKGMIDTIRLELANEAVPISVTNVMPTGVNTPFFDNARTRLGVQPRPPRPIYQPRHVADAILYAAAHPARDLYVGGGAKMFSVWQRFSPRTLAAYLGTTGFASQRTNQPESASSPNELFTPQTGDKRIQGDFTAETRSFSVYTWLETHPAAGQALRAAALLALGSWAWSTSRRRSPVSTRHPARDVAKRVGAALPAVAERSRQASRELLRSPFARQTVKRFAPVLPVVAEHSRRVGEGLLRSPRFRNLAVKIVRNGGATLLRRFL